jgi:hypothetical protein
MATKSSAVWRQRIDGKSNACRARKPLAMHEVALLAAGAAPTHRSHGRRRHCSRRADDAHRPNRRALNLEAKIQPRDVD